VPKSHSRLLVHIGFFTFFSPFWGGRHLCDGYPLLSACPRLLPGQLGAGYPGDLADTQAVEHAGQLLAVPLQGDKCYSRLGGRGGAQLL